MENSSSALIGPPPQDLEPSDGEANDGVGTPAQPQVLDLFVLVLLLAAVGFGVGVPELIIWFALVIAWVTYWDRQRRRPLR